jgi:putative membrane protein
VLRRFLVWWLVLAVAVGLTAGLLPGVHIDGGIGALLLISLVWGLVDGLIGPIARLLSLPITILTLGLFLIVVNGFLFLFTSWIVGALHVDNFWWAMAGAVLLAIFTWIGDAIVRSRRDRAHRL